MRTLPKMRAGLLLGPFVALTGLALALIVPAAATAQVPSPPMTLFGSITDAAGPIPVDTPVEAYVGDKLCSKKDANKSKVMPNGDAQLSVYVIDVYAGEQFPGCGKVGSDVRVKIGDRFAPQTIKWNAGLAELDLAFGGAQQVVVPTATPTPPRPAATGSASTPVPGGATTPGANGTAGAQGGGQPQGSASAVGTVPAGSPGAGSPAASPRGGLVTRAQDAGPGGGSSAGGGDGFPVWAVVLLGLGGVALIGGGIGFAMSRNRRAATEAPE